jgi:hypothetical protein
MSLEGVEKMKLYQWLNSQESGETELARVSDLRRFVAPAQPSAVAVPKDEDGAYLRFSEWLAWCGYPEYNTKKTWAVLAEEYADRIISTQLPQPVALNGVEEHNSIGPDHSCTACGINHDPLHPASVPQPVAPVQPSAVVAREDCVALAQKLQTISEEIGNREHPGRFKNEAEAEEWYGKVKGLEVEAHAEAIYAIQLPKPQTVGRVDLSVLTVYTGRDGLDRLVDLDELEAHLQAPAESEVKP